MEYTERIDDFQIRDVTWFYDPSKMNRCPLEFDIIKWEPSGSCYSVAFLIWESNGMVRLQSVGLRWLEANPTPAINRAILDFAERVNSALEEEELTQQEVSYALLPRIQHKLSGST